MRQSPIGNTGWALAFDVTRERWRTRMSSALTDLGRLWLPRLGVGVPESNKLAAARAWARVNQTPRAGQYDELARHEAVYRQAVFTELPVTVRSQLWKEQLRRFRVAGPELTAAQVRVLDEANALLTEPTLYTDPRPELLRRLKDIEAAAIDAFGRVRARSLLNTLGPAVTSTGRGCFWCDIP